MTISAYNNSWNTLSVREEEDNHMNDIVSTVQQLENTLANWDNVVDLISFIASIVTIMGAMLPIIKMILRRLLIKPINWKDRKAIRYSILNPINKSKNNEVVPIEFLIEFAKMMIPIIVLLMTVYICLFWVNYYGFKDNMKGYFLILIEINSCILCELIRTKSQSKKYRKPFEIINVVLLNFFVLEYVVEYGVLHGVEKMLVLMAIICICSFLTIEWIFFVNRDDDGNRSKWSVLIWAGRVICGSVYMIGLLYFTTSDALEICGKKASLLFVVVYTALCYIENKKINSIKVEFKIYKRQDEDVEATQTAIYQYEYNKVKYTLDNGCTKIIDSNEILSINYTIKNTIWGTVKNVIGKSKKANVTCWLENDDSLNFDGYNFINDLWVRFYKLNENEREIEIINSKNVKKIIIEYI